MGGAARFRDELYRYLSRSPCPDVAVIGMERRVDPAWLVQREMVASRRGRRVALNNVGFIVPGGERWTLLGNALHFLTEAEASRVEPSLRSIVTRQATVVRLAARRSDVLIAPCSAMAERVASLLPSVTNRITVRMHPVSRGLLPAQKSEQTILCPIIFEQYKHMAARLEEWVAAVEGNIDPAVRMHVTASATEVPACLANNRRLEFVGRLSHKDLRQLWLRSRAIFFPPGLESFGYPLAEARVNGQLVIARDTEQNKEIAGQALCGFKVGNAESLRQATARALSSTVAPDPSPFDPDAYFDWMLGKNR